MILESYSENGGSIDVSGDDTNATITKPQPVIAKKSAWKDPTFPNNMSTDCGKEVKGWPPEKVAKDLRPYLYLNGNNTSLILPTKGAQWQLSLGDIKARIIFIT